MDPSSRIESIHDSLNQIENILDTHTEGSHPTDETQKIFDSYTALNSIDYTDIDLKRVTTRLSDVNEKVKKLCKERVLGEILLTAVEELERHQENAGLLAELKVFNDMPIEALDIEKVVDKMKLALQDLNLMDLKGEITPAEKTKIEHEIDLFLEKVADRRDYISKLPNEVKQEIIRYLADTPASLRALAASSTTLTGDVRPQFPFSLMDLPQEILEYQILMSLDVKDIANMKLVRSHFRDMGRRAIARSLQAQTLARKMSILNKFLEHPGMLEWFWSKVSTPSERIDEQEKLILKYAENLMIRFGTRGTTTVKVGETTPGMRKNMMAQLEKYCPNLKVLILEGYGNSYFEDHRVFVADYFSLIPKSVERLGLGAFTFRDWGKELSQLNNIESLKILRISDENFDIQNLRFLKEAKNLETLTIHNTTLKLSDLSPLLGVKSLRHIACLFEEIDEISEPFDQIEDLEISDYSPDTRDNVEDQVEKILAKFPHLKRLSYNNMDLEEVETYAGREIMSELISELERKHPDVKFEIRRPS